MAFTIRRNLRISFFCVAFAGLLPRPPSLPPLPPPRQEGNGKPRRYIVCGATEENAAGAEKKLLAIPAP